MNPNPDPVTRPASLLRHLRTPPAGTKPRIRTFPRFRPWGAVVGGAPRLTPRGDWAIRIAVNPSRTDVVWLRWRGWVSLLHRNLAAVFAAAVLLPIIDPANVGNLAAAACALLAAWLLLPAVIRWHDNRLSNTLWVQVSAAGQPTRLAQWLLRPHPLAEKLLAVSASRTRAVSMLSDAMLQLWAETSTMGDRDQEVARSILLDLADDMPDSDDGIEAAGRLLETIAAR